MTFNTNGGGSVGRRGGTKSPPRSLEIRSFWLAIRLTVRYSTHMSETTKTITREELHGLLWARPFVRLAKELGYSYNELVAICTAFDIPRPSGGYWYRQTHGGAEAPSPLPPAKPGMANEIPLGPRHVLQDGRSTEPGAKTEAAGAKALAEAGPEVREKAVGADEADITDAVLKIGASPTKGIEEAGGENHFAPEAAQKDRARVDLSAAMEGAVLDILRQVTDGNKIGAQARLRGSYSYIKQHLEEIRLKADENIQWEIERDNWRSKIRVWFEMIGRIYYQHGPLNPKLGLDVGELGHRELERFRSWFYGEVLGSGFPEGREVIGILDVRDRKTLCSIFNRLPKDCGKYGPLPDFFDSVRMMEGMELRRSFEDGGGPWLVICQLQEGVTWREIKAQLKAKAKDIPLEKKYNLSPDSRALLKWILELRTDEYLLRMTPPVEDVLDTEIGIEVEWDDENLRAYLELLVEEINEKTEFRLRTINWHKYSQAVTRILVQRREVELDEVVRAVQILGLNRKRLLDATMVRAVIGRLIERK